MHGAGVDRPFGHRLGRLRLRREVLLRIVRELGSAAGGTEIIGVTLVGVPMRRRVRIDGHAADRIDHAILRGRVLMLGRVTVIMCRVSVCVIVCLCHGLTFIPLGGI
jgi:hypothetical protein